MITSDSFVDQGKKKQKTKIGSYNKTIVIVIFVFIFLSIHVMMIVTFRCAYNKADICLRLTLKLQHQLATENIFVSHSIG